MTSGRYVVAFLFTISVVSWASAAEMPSFNLDYSVCKATHIVLATEGDVIDGRLEVIESWKGDLEPGAELTLPELAAFANEQSRQVSWGSMRDLPEPFVHSVTGSRMVLFLIRPTQRQATVTTGGQAHVWLPANYMGQGGFKVSVAWVERGEAYVFRQLMNPGASLLTHIGTAIEMKARAAAFVTIEAALANAVNERDPVLASQAFRAFKRQEFHYACRDAIEKLGQMGKTALPMLRHMVTDRTLMHWHPEIIRAMVAAGGADIAPELVAIIEEELLFWSGRVGDLKKGWWNADPAGQRRTLRQRYSRLLAALRALEPLQYAPCRETVAKVRDLWRSEPSLNYVGSGQMSRACDALLQKLPVESPAPQPAHSAENR